MTAEPPFSLDDEGRAGVDVERQGEAGGGTMLCRFGVAFKTSQRAAGVRRGCTGPTVLMFFIFFGVHHRAEALPDFY